MSTSDVDGICEHLDVCKLGKISDEELFKQPPPAKEDCPICFLRMPSLPTGRRYKTCCGKVICTGCWYAPVYDNQGNEIDDKKCPFCRIPTPYTDEEADTREKKRMELDDPIAIRNLGNYCRDGRNGYPRDHEKALEFWHCSAALGYAGAYCNIGLAYEYGIGVEHNRTKATHYFELAAIGGNVNARHNLGVNEENAGNIDRALKNFMIAVGGGHSNSLNKIKELYLNGHATKDDYTTALRLYQEYLGEIKSVQRDKAAAAHERHRYY